MCLKLRLSNFTFRTLRILLDHGFEPNERIELTDDEDDLDEIAGMTPIQILATVISLSYSQFDADQYIIDVIQKAAEVLFSAGARLDLAAVGSVRPRKVPIKKNKSAKKISRKSDLSDIHEHYLTLIKNNKIMDLFGGKALVETMQSYWTTMKSISWNPEIMSLDIEKDPSSYVMDSQSKGGSDENSCAICWSEFGMFSNRSKICPISLKRGKETFIYSMIENFKRNNLRVNFVVCSACFQKRVCFNGNEYRVTDGQFNALIVKATTQEIIKRKEYEIKKQQMREEQKALQEQAKEGLFGSMLATFDTAHEEDSKNKAQNMTSKTNNLAADLNQTRNALLQRGEKLNSVSDKSEALRDQSREFAKLARELEQQSRKGFFGF